MDKSDGELLKECLNHTYKPGQDLRFVWYQNRNTCLDVARILNSEGYFASTDDVIYFFEKPWKYENDITDLLSLSEEVPSAST